VLCNTLPSESFQESAIPGSTNVPYTETYAEDSFPLLRTRHELVSLLGARGVTHSDYVVCYCRIGYTAAQVYFAARYAGFPRVALYDGSMTDWSARGGELVSGPGR